MAEIIEKKTGDEPISLDANEPAPAKSPGFDWKGTLPDDLPDSLKSLKGKTFNDLAESQNSLRKTLQERADTIKALEAAAKEPGEATTPGEIDPEFFQQSVNEYLETGEVGEDFLIAVQERGVRVNRETILRFFEWMKFEKVNMVENLSKYTQGRMTPEDVSQVMDWLKSGDSPFTADEAKGFDAMYSRGNYGFVDVLGEEFSKAVNNGYRHKGTQGPKIRGRPIDTAGDQGFKNAEDFQSQMLAVRADGKLSPFEKKQKQSELVQARRRQHGEI